MKIYTGRYETGSGWECAVAALDGGTKQDWVSGDFLKRFRNPEIVNLSPPEMYSTFEGEEYEATKAVWITWHVPKNRWSREALFRIVENGPFDVIIGSTLLFKEGINTFDEAAILFFGRKPGFGECPRSTVCPLLKPFVLTCFRRKSPYATGAKGVRRRSQSKPSPDESART